MPAALDLTGRRFDALIAVTRQTLTNGKTGWLCRCDCGASTLVPVNRLNIADGDRRAIRACETCRSRACVICGALYLKSGSAATCGGDACRIANRNQVNAAAAARAVEREPGIAAERQRNWLRRLHADPLRIAAYRARNAAQARLRRRRLTTLDRVLKRAKAREYYGENSDDVRQSFQRWLDDMPPDRRQRWNERVRQATREYRRRKALSKMMQDASILMQMEQTNEQ